MSDDSTLILVEKWKVMWIDLDGSVVNALTVKWRSRIPTAYTAAYHISDNSFINDPIYFKQHLCLSTLEYDILLLELVILEEKQRLRRKEREEEALKLAQQDAWDAVIVKCSYIEECINKIKAYRHDKWINKTVRRFYLNTQIKLAKSCRHAAIEAKLQYLLDYGEFPEKLV